MKVSVAWWRINGGCCSGAGFNCRGTFLSSRALAGHFESLAPRSWSCCRPSVWLAAGHSEVATVSCRMIWTAAEFIVRRRSFALAFEAIWCQFIVASSLAFVIGLR